MPGSTPSRGWNGEFNPVPAPRSAQISRKRRRTPRVVTAVMRVRRGDRTPIRGLEGQRRLPESRASEPRWER